MRRLLLLALLAPLAAAAAPETADRPDIPVDYRIGKEDVLELAVFRYEDLGGTVTVRPDGRITLDLIGDVQAEGRTTGEITEEIATKLAGFIPEPKVTLSVSEIRSMKVFVVGRVTAPGMYAVGTNPTLLQALAMAKGFTPWAKRGRIVLVRGETGKRVKVDYDDIVSGDQENYTLYPGDTLVVP
jgi:polysaccharide export outer membrane protein